MGKHLKLELPRLDATVKLGQALAAAMEEVNSCSIVALSGDLGAGKTTLVKAVGAALGVSEVVASPTFTMMNEYHSGRLPVYHFDFYRIGEAMAKAGESPPLDLLAMEFDEITSSKVVAMIEWPELFLVAQQCYLDEVDHISIKLSSVAASDSSTSHSVCLDGEENLEDGEGRVALISASGKAADRLLELLKTRINGGSIA
jgi:ATPase, YjeE family